MAATAGTETVAQFEQVHERINQLLKKADVTKKKGDLKTSQKLLVTAWKLMIHDIETRRS